MSLLCEARALGDGLLRTSWVALERFEVHIPRVPHQFGGEAVRGHGLEGNPAGLLQRHGHAHLGGSHLVGDVVPGHFVVDLVRAVGSPKLLFRQA